MPRIGLDFALKHIPGTVDPLQDRHEWYALIEFTGARADGNMRESMEALLGDAAEADLIIDATIAASEKQRDEIWHDREAMVEAQLFEGTSVHHDVSVPVSSVPEFIRTATAAVAKAVPGIRPVSFGHLGDGNIHFNLSQPTEMGGAAFRDLAPSLNRIVHDIVHALDGSFSAEHGVGQLKRDELTRYKSAIEIDMMRRIRAALDPNGVMNPDKVL
jgi:D-lactate dehydrogenase (cytochrome)